MKETLGVVLHSEHWGGADRTLEVCMRKLSSEKECPDFETVFVLNDQGLYFSVYKSILELIDGSGERICFDNEDKLDAYLKGESPDKVTQPSPAVKPAVQIGHWNNVGYVGEGGKKPVIMGAWCALQYNEDIGNPDIKPSIHYFSFGGYGDDELMEEIEVDKFGIPDNDIYYFIDDGEAELKTMMDPDNRLGDFLILSYELRYQEEKTHVAIIDDKLKSSGQLFLDIVSDVNSDVNTSVTVEINSLPGDDVPVPCFHLHFDGDALAASFYKVGNAFYIRPETDVRISSTKLPNGEYGFLMR